MLNEHATIEAYLECWSERALDRARTYLSPGCVFSDPILGKRLSAEAFIDGSSTVVGLLESVDLREIQQEGEEFVALYDITTIFGSKVLFEQSFWMHEGKIVRTEIRYDKGALRRAARPEGR